jgi:hypothetical protein
MTELIIEELSKTIASLRIERASDQQRLFHYERKLDEMTRALKPFAEYADANKIMPAGLIITAGSRLARRQLTMGDCYAARAALGENL